MSSDDKIQKSYIELKEFDPIQDSYYEKYTITVIYSDHHQEIKSIWISPDVYYQYLMRHRLKKNTRIGNNCTICLETISINQLIYQLACGHIFHQMCRDSRSILKWIEEKRACPNCRKLVIFKI